MIIRGVRAADILRRVESELRRLEEQGRAASARAADPGIACHVHCGCHAGIALDEAASAPLPSASRPRYERVSLAAASIFPDRLPRPPRA